MENDPIELDITNFLGLEEAESDPSVNYYVPFCLVLMDKNNRQVQLFLDYEEILDIARATKKYLDNFELIKEGYTEGEEDDEEDENKLGETDSGVPTGASYFSEKCPKCGNKMELKEFQGQSDNKDIDGIYKCPKCGYVEEIE